LKLFLCEKPSQAREIARHVGAFKKGDGCITANDVTVTWAIGHLVELAKPEHYEPALTSWNLSLLPVVPQAWALQPKVKTMSQYKVVLKLLKQASEVVIATDADREGEVIARELMQMAGYSGKVSRLWLSAFDDASIRKALGKLMPGGKTLPMFYSGMGRSHADWLAGMNLTMALTKGFGTGGKDGTLHCGRVQTPVLALIVRRERAIANFKPVTHYHLSAVFELGGQSVPMTWLPAKALVNKDGLALDRAKVEAVAARIAGRRGRVDGVETKAEREVAPLPYSLGALQREASARFGMKAQTVLDAAQALYEKHKATSYPRTDCEYLPASMVVEAGAVLDAIERGNPDLQGHVGQARQMIAGVFSGRAFNNSKITAHHAIIPTSHPGVDRGAMSKDERTIYDMVCRRYLAQFLGDYQYLKTAIVVGCEGEQFRVTGKTPKVMGWRALEPEQVKKHAKGEEPEQEPAVLPAVAEGAAAMNLKCELAIRKTTSPKRYTEGTLLAAMESIDKEIEDPRWKAVMKNKEKAGIGTDATRSAIIEGLFKRSYIEAVKKELHPTAKGLGLIELIEKVAPEVADPVLTAQWEDGLSQIERGEAELVQFENNLAAWLQGVIEGIRQKAGTLMVDGSGHGASSARSTRISGTATGDGASSAGACCPSCGKPMRRINGTRGFFWGCTGYSEGCRTTLQDREGEPVPKETPAPMSRSENETLKFPCPKCQKPLRRRLNGSREPFWGCTGYPDCKHTQPDEGGRPGNRVSDVQGRTSQRERPASRPEAKTARAGEPCPTCGKGVLVAKTLRESNKPFVGCNHFPACRFFAWPETAGGK
jgi:DNA topoisomerase-3